MTNATITNKLVKVDSKPKKKKKRKKIGEVLFILALIAYPIIHWGVFWLYPNIKTFILPFELWDGWEGKYIFPNPEGLFANFKNYIESFLYVDQFGEHSMLWKAFFNTFHSLWINIILLPLAAIIGYALAKHVPGEKFFRIVFFLPNIISTVVMCLAFRFMFEANDALFVGPAAKVLRFLGINFQGWDLTYINRIWLLIYIFCIWAGLSVNVVLISSAFQRIPKEITEAARLDGISFFGEFFRIGLPLIMPTMTTFMTNAVIAVTGFYLQPFLLLNGAQEEFLTIPMLVFTWTKGGADQAKMIGIATIGILFSAVMFPLIMGARALGKRLTPDVEF